MEITKSIFREYDIRGIYPNEINEKVINKIAKSIAIKCNEQKVEEICIGRDGRISGPVLLDSMSKSLSDYGINVVNWPLQRIILSYFASFYVRLITRMKIMDPTSGFVCYSVKSLKKLNLSAVEFNGYAFQIEMKFKLFLNKLKIVEIPIIFTDRKLGKSKLNSSIIGEAVYGVILMKLKSLFN